MPLGVLFKNETSHEDMIGILSHLQQYVPTNTTEDEIHNLLTNESFKVFLDHFHYLLIGGDQLTIEEQLGQRKE